MRENAHSFVGHPMPIPGNCAFPPHLSTTDEPERVTDEVNVWDHLLDDLLIKRDSLSLCQSIEQSLQSLFLADQVIYWQNIPSMGHSYSESLHISTVYSTGLAGICYFSRVPTKITTPQSNPSFNVSVDGRIVRPGAEFFLISLTDPLGDLIGVTEIVKQIPTTDQEQRFAHWFSQKFRYLHRWLSIPRDIDGLSAELQICDTEAVFRRRVFPKIADDFASRDVEIWKYDENTKQLGRYTAHGFSTLPHRTAALPGLRSPSSAL
jgi:hypothetical protein